MRFIKKTPETLCDANVWTPETDTADDPVSLEIDQMTGAKYGLLHTHTNQLRVNSGDWVLRFEDGTLHVLNPSDFEAQYAPYDMADRVNEPKKLKAKASE